MALPIGGFMPIPLAMMIPFMATQSIVMGDAFGKAYQFGKRKISAMSNEDFNKLTLVDLISSMQQDFKLAIPKVEQSIADSTQLQNFIVAEMLKIIPKLITSTEITGTSGNLYEDLSHTIGGPDAHLPGYHGGSLPSAQPAPPPPAPVDYTPSPTVAPVDDRPVTTETPQEFLSKLEIKYRDFQGKTVSKRLQFTFTGKFSYIKPSTGQTTSTGYNMIGDETYHGRLIIYREIQFNKNAWNPDANAIQLKLQLLHRRWFNNKYGYYV